MSEAKGDDGRIRLSRRDVMKVGLGFGAAALGEYGLIKFLLKNPPQNAINKEPLMLAPESVDGVDVYGLKEKITSVDMVDHFYAFLDKKFADSVGTKLEDRIRQRKEFLNPNERNLEVVVRRSAYETFLKRKNETGVDFVEWIKIHVDVMNRCMEDSVPPVELKAVLKRVVVIEDEATSKVWNEAAYKKGDPGANALDWFWVNRFWSYTFDTDESWAVSEDYRDSGGGFFFEFRHENGKTVIGTPPGSETFDRSYTFPEKDDSLSGKNNVKFDMGLIHEWSHYLLNLPDEYGQDVHDELARFKHFTIGTGSFEEPFFSPHLSYLMKDNIASKARDCFTDGMGKKFPSIRPKEIEISTGYQDPSIPSNRVEVRRVRIMGSSYYDQKSVPEKADQSSDSGAIKLNNDLFQDISNCWVVKIGNGPDAREVFLPVAAFNMSKIAGLDSAKYNIIFSGYDDPGRVYQEVKYVDDSEIDKYLQESQDLYYAKMKVEGTSTWFVWFLRA